MSEALMLHQCLTEKRHAQSGAARLDWQKFAAFGTGRRGMASDLALETTRHGLSIYLQANVCCERDLEGQVYAMIVLPDEQSAADSVLHEQEQHVTLPASSKVRPSRSARGIATGCKAITDIPA